MIYYLMIGAMLAVIFIIRMSEFDAYSWKRAIYYFVTMTMLTSFLIYFVFENRSIIDHPFGIFILNASAMATGTLILIGDFLYQEKQDKKRKMKMYKTEPAHSPEELETLTKAREILVRKIEQDRKEAREKNETMVRDWRQESLQRELKREGLSPEEQLIFEKAEKIIFGEKKNNALQRILEREEQRKKLQLIEEEAERRRGEAGLPELSEEEREAELAKISKEEIDETIEELQKMTMRPMIRIHEEKRENLSPFESKFGGLPYIPQELMPPTDKQGRQLRLLAQFNLEELPANSLFPNKGILQFWILNDRRHGVESYTLTTQDTARVLYYDMIDKNVTEEELIAKYDPYREDEKDPFPVCYELAMKFTLDEEPLNGEDSYWNELFAKLWNDKYIQLAPIYEMEELPNAWDRSDYDVEFITKLGGYPNFVQGDFRNNLCKYEGEKKQKLLFQITPSNNFTDDPWIVWGDFGCANFFITDEDLANRNFANVWYTWDCS